jgi:mRNA-degrading endonuclease toxin of MazEF toxin-antitoxin module
MSHTERVTQLVTRVLNAILVAPITTRIRQVASELPLGEETGLRKPCVASFDNLQRVRPGALTERVGALASPRRQIRRALAALADC